MENAFKQYTARETWLAKASAAIAVMFAKAGFPIPANVRVSCGLPSRGAFTKARVIGQAWASRASRDKHYEVFISPTIDAAGLVLSTLVHELVHVTVGIEAGHRGAFVKCASSPNSPASSASTRTARLST